MKKKRPVLQDVADRVGVTKMTVSRFLRNPEQVSVALRGKIAAALDELGYIPNRAPDILSNATSRAIGVLLPSLTNQVFAEVLRGIESVTDAHGYQTMLAHYGYKPEMEQERLESMLSWNNDDLAVGAAFECQRLGLKVPDDMAIAGFHGHDIGQVMEPRLASVLTPRERMGSIGAERLLARIRGESVTPKMLDLGFTLSPGGSI
ncbi:LacI family DNA-binding transcriptional regulator [Escherichia coli]|uniref:LacI family DNA-binding transcriptional regulator n=1 Tax=Escherichia coli TaxID=562 RepID=UPI000F46DD3F|nr:LacI family DNA-binding transcriptional regulator [Escherichia coli]ROI18490.1 hypothetical protein BFD09_06155 [Escherichia coli]